MKSFQSGADVCFNLEQSNFIQAFPYPLPKLFARSVISSECKININSNVHIKLLNFLLKG